MEHSCDLSANENPQSARALYEAFKRSNDVMFYCSREGVIQDVNDAFTKHYGWTREEAVGQTPRILKSSHSSPDLYRRMWSSILDPAKGYWRGEMINKAKDGREIPLVLTIAAVKDAQGQITGYISNAMDMTQQVALQARVAQAEALATIGEMAAVVAHEIRNPLGSIVMAAKQIASGELGAKDRAPTLQILRKESQRLTEALGTFLAFARPRHIKLEHEDLNRLVSEVATMIKSNPDLARTVVIRLAPDERLKPFPMDRDQLRQVIWNIAINALQAMGEKGTLTIETGRAGGYSYFKIGDTGPGIPPASLAQIFKPFHTTKPQGTGLGLAIADRIIKAHGGRIDVRSKLGVGTAFSVYLPAVEE